MTRSTGAVEDGPSCAPWRANEDDAPVGHLIWYLVAGLDLSDDPPDTPWER